MLVTALAPILGYDAAARIAKSALEKNVSLKEAALALGSPQWRSMVRVTLPTARVGLVTAVILGVARIAGETAPVLFTAGGTQQGIDDHL